MLIKEQIDSLHTKLHQLIDELYTAFELLNDTNVYKKALLDVAERDIKPTDGYNPAWKQTMSAIIDSAYKEGYKDGLTDRKAKS